jgi:hypothetical protein
VRNESSLPPPDLGGYRFRNKKKRGHMIEDFVGIEEEMK